MLVIRKAQMDALATEVVLGFEDRLCVFLQRAHPDWCEAMGVAQLSEFIRHGVRRAQAHGLVVELDVARYVIAMQALGMRFDEAPEHEWARELFSKGMPNSEKLDRLRDAVFYQSEARRIRNAC